MEKTLIPIPTQVVEHHKRAQAKAAVDKMMLENMLLKHLVDMLDPEHDYQFNNETLQLEKVQKEVPGGKTKDDVQPGDNQDAAEQKEDTSIGKSEESDVPLGLGSIAGAQAACCSGEDKAGCCGEGV